MNTRLLFLAICLLLCVACSKDDDAPAREEFVDKNFIELLHTEYNVPVTSNGAIDLDNEMTQLRLKAIVNLVISYIQIDDLTGIRNLTSLDKLFLVSKIERIDLSGMKYLRRLSCHSSTLVNLNIRNTPLLELLEIGACPLTSLDLSGHYRLEYINCRECKLTTLNLENLSSLNQLNCERNCLSALNASGMKLLHDRLAIDCGEQKDENGNARTLHLTLSESQRQAWLEKVAGSADSNANVEVTFK